MTIKNLILDAIQDEPGLTSEEIVQTVKNKNPEYAMESITRELRRLNGKDILRLPSGRYYMNYGTDKKQKKVEEWL